MYTNEKWMKLALSLAAKGQGKVSPNPMVGAVVVKDDCLIGQGYHEQYGGFHAERNALNNCLESPKGADLYVTLEPCCHFGKTPPCTDAIIEAGISRVFIGSSDPNPLVAGKGIQLLKENGITVTENVLQSDCDQLNEVFFHFITHKRPFVTLKYAMTMDGKIATYTGESKWISGEQSRQQVQQLRGKVKAIMVGIQTVIQDDPLLTCRIPDSTQPIRIICDSKLRIPLESQLVKTAKKYKTFNATAIRDTEKEKKLQDAGIEIIYAPNETKKVNLELLMDELGKRGIDSLLLEGGGTLNFAMLKCGIVNRVQAYIAPKIFGGEHAKTPVEGEGFQKISEAVALKIQQIKQIGDDLYLEMDVTKEA